MCSEAPGAIDGWTKTIQSDCSDHVYVTVQTCDSACNATDTYHQGPVTVVCQGGSLPDQTSTTCHVVMGPIRLLSYYCLAFL
jgi:hypothetical protein